MELLIKGLAVTIRIPERPEEEIAVQILIRSRITHRTVIVDLYKHIQDLALAEVPDLLDPTLLLAVIETTAQDPILLQVVPAEVAEVVEA